MSWSFWYVLQCIAARGGGARSVLLLGNSSVFTLHTARHCKRLQETARHCKRLQETARDCKCTYGGRAARAHSVTIALNTHGPLHPYGFSCGVGRCGAGRFGSAAEFLIVGPKRWVPNRPKDTGMQEVEGMCKDLCGNAIGIGHVQQVNRCGVQPLV